MRLETEEPPNLAAHIVRLYRQELFSIESWPNGWALNYGDCLYCSPRAFLVAWQYNASQVVLVRGSKSTWPKQQINTLSIPTFQSCRQQFGVEGRGSTPRGTVCGLLCRMRSVGGEERWSCPGRGEIAVTGALVRLTSPETRASRLQSVPRHHSSRQSYALQVLHMEAQIVTEVVLGRNKTKCIRDCCSRKISHIGRWWCSPRFQSWTCNISYKDIYNLKLYWFFIVRW